MKEGNYHIFGNQQYWRNSFNEEKYDRRLYQMIQYSLDRRIKYREINMEYFKNHYTLNTDTQQEKVIRKVNKDMYFILQMIQDAKVNEFADVVTEL